ncbi:DUF4349 domain-containing protein [Pseudonocardia kujensis]|uniref:DUF4349 domain-containing protein n=1 Tax=Pseudonocardia kujensis TaxID=1128675 RepID=UPI001E5045FC|nr:DUF4349 domain-containing protein [Pseudonocardia kujensis]MCE0767649.1 DUF4349 domain-containing protein [Pseudonocardia kujensis]
MRRWAVRVAAGLVVLASASVVTGVALRGSGASSSGAVDPGIAAHGRIAPDGATSSSDEAAAPGPGVARSAPSTDSAGVAAPVAPPGRQAPLADVAAGRDVVRTAELTVQVGDPVAAAAQVRTAVAATGGFVADEHAGNGSAGFTLRVPADRLDALTERLAGLGTVTSRTSRAEDVSAPVADLEGRVAAQRASVARVRALLDRATTIGEIVSIESELAAREADLESLQRRLAVLQDSVALATVEIALLPVPPAAVPGPSGFLGGLAVGWEGLRAIGRVSLAALGFVVPMLPVVAVLAGLVLLGRRTYRARRRTPQPPAGPAAGG